MNELLAYSKNHKHTYEQQKRHDDYFTSLLWSTFFLRRFATADDQSKTFFIHFSLSAANAFSSSDQCIPLWHLTKYTTIFDLTTNVLIMSAFHASFYSSTVSVSCVTDSTSRHLAKVLYTNCSFNFDSLRELRSICREQHLCTSYIALASVIVLYFYIL